MALSQGGTRGGTPGGARGGAPGRTAGGGLDGALIRVCDLAGRPRGSGFLADTDGTMVTSHEAVDGLARLVLHAPGEQVCLVEASAVTALPEHGLALVATEGLDLRAAAGRARRPGPPRADGTAAAAAPYRGLGGRHHRGHVHRDRPLPPDRRGVRTRPGRRGPERRRRARRGAAGVGRARGRRGDRGGARRRGDRPARRAPGRRVRGAAARRGARRRRSPSCWRATRRPSPPTGPTSTWRAPCS